MTEVRWQQRLFHFQKALNNLSFIVNEAHNRELSIIERQGMVQAFEMAHELSWKVLKDYFTYQGNSDITGSRDAFRTAFSAGIIVDGQTWMESIQSRNLTTHAYNQETANDINQKIIKKYFPAFQSLNDKLSKLATHTQ